ATTAPPPADETAASEDEPPTSFSFDEPAASSSALFAADDFSDDFSQESAAEEFTFAAPPAAEEFSFDVDPDAPFNFDETTEAAPTFDDQPAEEEFSLEGNGFSFDQEEDAADRAEEDGEFDFSNMSFGEDEPTKEPAIALAAIPLASPPSPAAPRAEPRPPQPAAEQPEPDVTPLPIPPTVRQRRNPFYGVLVLVVLLLTGLTGAAAYFFWQGGLPDASRLLERLTGDTAPVSLPGQIRLTDLTGYFVQNQESGQLFVIQGKALNEYPESRSAIAVKGVLFNQAGQPVVQQTVFSGNPLDDEILRTLPFARIEESMNNQFGDSLSNLNVGPGKAIPFTIVFRKLPSDLAEFTVEAADSRPGSG
ncbi:MAG: DUF3426 domain-containing protein, partial [Desulfuromonadales bacterium]|nr:DUF3426 domain-containing protein [Desulfuromonadales bacterium]